MYIEQLLDCLKLERAYLSIIAPDWHQSMEMLPAQPAFLECEQIRRFFPYSGLQKEILPMLESVASQIAADPALLRLAWHAHYTLAHGRARFAEWPPLDEYFDNNGGLFYLLIACSLIELVEKKHQQLGIPPEYLSCCGRISGFNATHQAGYGKPGINRKQLHWIRHYLDATCFRIGRLEYMISKASSYHVAVYQHRTTGQTLAMPSGVPLFFDSDGMPLFPEDDRAVAAFAGSFVRSAQSIQTLAYHPRGFARSEIVTLGEEWEPRVLPDQHVLGLHIPEGGKMTLELCRESFEAAFLFFRQYFPDLSLNAIFCSSWIFSPYYEEALPESNLARLMREVYLFPAQSTGRDGVYFIFGREGGDYRDYRDYPPDNSIRRAMLDCLNSGKKLRTGSMFLLKEHLQFFGSQYYRRQAELT